MLFSPTDTRPFAFTRGAHASTPSTFAAPRALERAFITETSFWRSSLSIWNSDSQTAYIYLEYLPEKTDNSHGGVRSSVVVVPAFGTVSFGDLAVMRAGFFSPPGPSGLPDDCD